MSGEPSYIELCAPDAGRAHAFYGGLLGWNISERGEAETGSLGVGIHGDDESALFEVFFTVDDLDASLEQVRALGGTVDGEVRESEGFGRWAECADDQGIRFGLRQPG